MRWAGISLLLIAACTGSGDAAPLPVCSWTARRRIVMYESILALLPRDEEATGMLMFSVLLLAAFLVLSDGGVFLGGWIIHRRQERLQHESADPIDAAMEVAPRTPVNAGMALHLRRAIDTRPLSPSHAPVSSPHGMMDRQRGEST